MRHELIVLAIVAASTYSTYAQAKSHLCSPVSLTMPTRWGGNELIQIDMWDKPIRSPHGFVSQGWGENEPATNTLLQVFERNPFDPLTQPDHDKMVPILACVTDASGASVFSLPDGEYEIRASMNPGINVSSVFIRVHHGLLTRSRKILIPLHVGT